MLDTCLLTVMTSLVAVANYCGIVCMIFYSPYYTNSPSSPPRTSPAFAMKLNSSHYGFAINHMMVNIEPTLGK